MKKRLPRPVRNSLISMVVLAVLFVAAGVIYTFVADRGGSKPPPPPDAAAIASEPAAITPKPPAANAPEGVALQSLTSPVAAGSNAMISILTDATSTCTISVVYNGVASKDSGLAPKTADAYGSISWSWTVDPTAPAGSWPVTVTCVYHGRSGVGGGNIQVTR